jgi:hypothetical protein
VGSSEFVDWPNHQSGREKGQQNQSSDDSDSAIVPSGGITGLRVNSTAKNVQELQESGTDLPGLIGSIKASAA